ncbi:hypothetical protein Q8F55_007410 [Vanrija albida]|uniref:Uncharacterized protein n=1 Tax=Vanrija albida TaxID=181172 RepID=A0ABR3PTM9_9TREE
MTVSTAPSTAPGVDTSLDYKGKIAFVSGGGRGIGLAITRALAAVGATVIITWVSQDPAAEVKKITAETGARVVAYRCAAEKSADVDAVVERAAAEVGEVDLVVANAGVCLWRDTIDITDDDLRWIMETNLFGPIYLARAFARHWLGLPASVDPKARGERPAKRNLNKKILCISSISALVNMTPQVQMSYNASKAGVTMACKSLAGEWAPYGITVNTISPGYVKTDMTMHPPPGEGAAWVKKWGDMTPVDRFAEPSEIGDLVVLLGSGRASSFLTGHDIVIDGGYTTY